MSGEDHDLVYGRCRRGGRDGALHPYDRLCDGWQAEPSPGRDLLDEAKKAYPGLLAGEVRPLPSEVLVADPLASGEVRVTDPSTGGQKGTKPGELGFIDPLALEELGLVASFGGVKYDSFNYLKGYRWSLSFNAGFRHFLKFLRGEDRDFSTCKMHAVWENSDWSCTDCGSGLLHVTHLAWHGLALTSFVLRKIGTDDRSPR